MKGIYEISDYGAEPNGTTLNTEAIQRAIDDCCAAGGGQLTCGPGRFLTGSIELKSNVELHLESGCELVGSPDLEHYEEFVADGFVPGNAPEMNTKSLIRAVNADNIAITGPGKIDGSGLAFYNTDDMRGRFFSKPPTARPRMVMFFNCRDVHIEDAAFIDSPCWTFWLMKCERVRITGARVVGDQRMINNDGIDLDSCRDVTVSDCRIRTGDDCIILRAIQQMFEEPAPCENITVSNCVLDSWCQAIRVGCPGDGTIRDATFSNLTIHSENHGISFENPKRYLPENDDGRADIHDILFSNVMIESANLPIRVTVEDGIELERLSDLSFSDLRIRGGGPLTFKGSPETTIRDIKVSNTEIYSSGDRAVDCRYCENVNLTNVTLSHGG